MTLKILIRGWLDIFHSYAVVNYFLMKELLEHEDLDIFYEPVKYYNPKWSETFVNSLDYKPHNKEKVDLIFTIAFPYTILKTNTPQILFYTAEFGEFRPEHFNMDLNQIAELVNNKKLYLLTPSNRSAQAFLKHNINVEVIPHGFDSRVFYREKESNVIEYRKTLKKIPSTSTVFLNISAMTGNKNLHVVLRAFIEACKINKDIFLILKGNSDLYTSKEYLEKTMYMYGLFEDFKNCFDKIIIFDSTLTFQEMRAFYNVADFYVDAGVNEGFCLPVLEARACGCKVLMHENAPMVELNNSTFKNIEELTNLMINNKEVPDKPLSPRFNNREVCNELINLFTRVVVDNS